MQPAEVLALVTDALETLGVVYCVGGSFASSAYGEPRATRDAGILSCLLTRFLRWSHGSKLHSLSNRTRSTKRSRWRRRYAMIRCIVRPSTWCIARVFFVSTCL